MNPTSTFDANKGQLFGDRGLTSMLTGMRQEIAASVAGNPAGLDALADLGISTGKASGGAASDGAIAGRLTIDDAALTAALSADPFAVQKLLGGVPGIDGFAQRFERTIDQQLGALTPGGTRTRGLLESRLEAAPEEAKRLREQQSAMERRLEAKEKRLRAQFSAMESALGTAQTQQSWLSGQIAGLTANR
jgi:flagellar hook-associated protein 2